MSYEKKYLKYKKKYLNLQIGTAAPETPRDALNKLLELCQDQRLSEEQILILLQIYNLDHLSDDVPNDRDSLIRWFKKFCFENTKRVQNRERIQREQQIHNQFKGTTNTEQKQHLGNIIRQLRKNIKDQQDKRVADYIQELYTTIQKLRDNIKEFKDELENIRAESRRYTTTEEDKERLIDDVNTLLNDIDIMNRELRALELEYISKVAEEHAKKKNAEKKDNR
uniref:Uncharacterized protein n=1 Tax=Megaviridae environmental sample TaxID=1737588 RepID=A0A5J6VK63_9VIRU|nr:MAG: hypothetical protein [Megaviridae environmental sample]